VPPTADLNSLVVGASEAGVVLVANEPHPWKLRYHHLSAAVGRVVVDNKHFVGLPLDGVVDRDEAIAQQVAQHPGHINHAIRRKERASEAVGLARIERTRQ